MKVNSRVQRKLTSIRKFVLQCLNSSLRNVELKSIGYGIHVKFSKGEVHDSFRGSSAKRGWWLCWKHRIMTLWAASLHSSVGFWIRVAGLLQRPQSRVHLLSCLHGIFLYRKKEAPCWEDQNFNQRSRKSNCIRLAVRAAFSATNSWKGVKKVERGQFSRWSLRHEKISVSSWWIILGGSQTVQAGLFSDVKAWYQSHGRINLDYWRSCASM